MSKKTVSEMVPALLMLGILTLAFEIQPAQSITTPTLSAWAFVTPTIDGVLSRDEWDDAAVETFNLSTPEEHHCILYVKNDEQNLYFALIIKDEEFNPFPPEGGACDYVLIEFDNDHDGVMWEVGDDCLFLRGDGGFINDGSFRPDGGWGPDDTYNGTNDIVGAVSHVNPTEIGDYIFECLHPLNTEDDAYDFSLSFGDIVGFRINYCDGASPGGYHSFWPEAFYANIIVAKPRILTVTVDIHPTTLNLRSSGRWITAYIELPEGYDAADVNVSSIMLNDTIQGKPKPIAIRDYDNDVIPSLMVKFERIEVISYILADANICQLLENRFLTVTLIITGYLSDGAPFQGSDTIRIIYTMPRCLRVRTMPRFLRFLETLEIFPI